MDMKMRTGQTIFLEIRVDDHLSTHLKKINIMDKVKANILLPKAGNPNMLKKKMSNKLTFLD